MLLVGLRVVFLLWWYSNSISEMFSPSMDVLEDIISDLSASIILQTSLLDETLLDDLDLTDEFVTVRFFTSFISCANDSILKQILSLELRS